MVGVVECLGIFRWGPLGNAVVCNRFLAHVHLGKHDQVIEYLFKLQSFKVYIFQVT